MSRQEIYDLKKQAAEALFQIGRLYEFGEGDSKDEAEAVKWYRMAADLGLAGAASELAKCYTFGIGVRKNRTTASKWLHKAADRGDIRAMLLLGLWYQSVDGKARTAVRWFRRAAELGDARAMFELGDCYENGEGVKKDFDQACIWFCRAVAAAPEDEQLYQAVQERLFDPNLKALRESLKSAAKNETSIPSSSPATMRIKRMLRDQGRCKRC